MNFIFIIIFVCVCVSENTINVSSIPTRGNNYIFFFFIFCFGKQSAEFHHLTCNVSKVEQKMGKCSPYSLAGAACRFMMFHFKTRTILMAKVSKTYKSASSYFQINIFIDFTLTYLLLNGSRLLILRNYWACLFLFSFMKSGPSFFLSNKITLKTVRH